MRVDPVLSKGLEHVTHGWPKHMEDLRLRPYFNRAFELSVEQDLSFVGTSGSYTYSVPG